MSKLVIFAALLLFAASSASSACNQQDLVALLAIKSSFPANSFPSSWTTATDCCSWDYIQCYGTGRVTALYISDNNNIVGSIPPAIGDLSALQDLGLYKLPGLSGPVPSELLSKLTGLQSLSISETNVSGPVPPSLSTITGLRDLNLNNNSFVGNIPASLGDLVKLSTISLSSNRLTGSIPGTLFSKLSTGMLATLALSENMLTGAIPKSFRNVSFGNIYLGGNQLTGDASFLFGRTKPAFQIALSRNNLAFDLTNVRYPLSLGYLDISHNQINGSISSQITQLTDTGLYLDVSYNMLCGKIPSGGNFPQLESQYFANNTCLCGNPLPPCS